ncbi:SAM50-like protein CG7639 [Uranotaenia lowii]|uniref:SAM50-like protein CG7639 n=1 Tax=Uranotaenia lowii TaxID=190385 RepID=UPI00247B232E|nr:SAM50-like protein CG7639 [Uranotaenia lowii]XP_055602340.1 SAM50-like protein CG7639 [Uranotaenia lowii]XP_055602341.1 SAM50-like protein CG7639 [Uranotaenia lowii]
MGSGNSKDPPVTERKKDKIDMAFLKARVDRVNVKGLSRTCDDYVHRAVRNLFGASTFQDVIDETSNVKDNLMLLGIFKNLKIKIDVSRGTDSTPNGYEVTFEGSELSRLTGSIGTEFGQNDGAATAELLSPNVSGRGERLSLNYSYSYVKSSVLNLRLTKPYYHTVVGDYNPETSIGIFKHSSHTPWSKFRTDEAGALLDFSFTLPFGLSNSLQYEIGMKEVFTTPFFIIETCEPRLASIIRYIGIYEGRDSSIYPTKGTYVKATNELIGSPLNQFGLVKSDVHCELNVPLLAGISLQLCGRAGILVNDKRKEAIPIYQLFYPGGPQSLRGFEQAGVGPHRDDVAEGCQSYWATGVHLWSPLPFSRAGDLSDLFRLHLFYNFGTCNTFTTDKLRSTVGAGLAVRIGQKARIEFNCCQPLSFESGDRVKEGFQFGIGYDFI